ncbi:MAG TPA: DUF3800 domain-containing protein [Thermomicrobiales bacterium]|jgi:hypothetical protein
MLRIGTLSALNEAVGRDPISSHRQIEARQLVSTFAYLDESGDTGFKRLGSGTSDYFVLTLVLIDDPGPVYAAIEELRDALGMARREEFRFAKTAHPRRERFLDELRRHDISVRALVVHKALLLGKPELRSQEALYATLVRNILLRNGEALSETTLVMDEYIRGRRAQQEFNTSLRRALNLHDDRRRLREIHHRKSQGDALIQATDMISGAIYASRARSNDRYLDLIKPRIHEIWDWDGQEQAIRIDEN